MKISASRINLYLECSLRYKFNYVDKISKFSPSPHLAYGSAIHKALEELNLSMLKKQIDVIDFFDYFDKEWHKNLEENKIKESQYTDKLYSMGIKTLDKFYHNNIDYEPIGAEIKFDVPIILPNGKELKEHSLYGLIDVVFKRKNKLYVVDYKTSKEKYSRFMLDTSIQLCLYSYAFRYLLNKQVFPSVKKDKEDNIAYYVLLKDYEKLDGDLYLQSKQIKEKHYNRFFYILETFLKGVENKIFLPNYNTGGNNCKWCDYKSECVEFEGIKK